MCEKRFQECNWLVKLWRYRFYLPIPFKYFYYSYIKPFKVCRDEFVDGEITHTDNFDVMKGKNLWSLLIGSAQGPMRWYYTSDEVFDNIRKSVLDGKK